MAPPTFQTNVLLVTVSGPPEIAGRGGNRLTTPLAIAPPASDHPSSRLSTKLQPLTRNVPLLSMALPNAGDEGTSGETTLFENVHRLTSSRPLLVMAPPRANPLSSAVRVLPLATVVPISANRTPSPTEKS